MRPIIYSAPIVDATNQLSQCEMVPGIALALEAHGDRVSVYAWKKSWLSPRSGRRVLVGFLDAKEAEMVKPHLERTRLRVRVVSLAGLPKKPLAVALSVWADQYSAPKENPAPKNSTPAVLSHLMQN